MKFTKELEKSGQLAFLEVNVQQLKDGFLATSVYKKPTHTERYLQYSSHHYVNQKVNVLVHYSPEPTESYQIMKKD